jgi:hypothetical protein
MRGYFQTQRTKVNSLIVYFFTKFYAAGRHPDEGPSVGYDLSKCKDFPDISRLQGTFKIPITHEMLNFLLTST